MKTFVLGDIHGACRALTQVFERSGFDTQNDRLIFLGDVADGWSQVPESIEELMKVKHLIHLLGNHDNWALNWMLEGSRPDMWVEQGGLATMQAYSSREWRAKKNDHRDFLLGARLKFLDEDNRLYVHGGIDIMKSLEQQEAIHLIWDRMLFDWTEGVRDFKEIFIGHTITLTEDTDKPLNYGKKDNIWRLDTGAGYYGKLTIMDVETKEYWQSDAVPDLYPDEPGRAG